MPSTFQLASVSPSPVTVILTVRRFGASPLRFSTLRFHAHARHSLGRHQREDAGGADNQY
jgi:hypothetical protein